MSRGNRRAQRQRRKVRRKFLPKPPRQQVQYQLIDGNMTYYPTAFCSAHTGYLTAGLINTHRCRKRHCKALKPLQCNKKGKVTFDYFTGEEIDK